VATGTARDRSNEWFYGVAASLLLGVGHLLGTVAMGVGFVFGPFRGA